MLLRIAGLFCLLIALRGFFGVFFDYPTWRGMAFVSAEFWVIVGLFSYISASAANLPSNPRPGSLSPVRAIDAAIA
jgi:hypothetical protein